MEYHQIEQRANTERKGNNINILFLPVAPDTIRVQLEQVEATSSKISPPNSTDKPMFSSRPNTQATDFDFVAEILHLPFKLNVGDDTELTHDQQSRLIDLIYNHPEVLSLHDEELRFCDQINHTIPMTIDRPVYLLHPNHSPTVARGSV